MSTFAFFYLFISPSLCMFSYSVMSIIPSIQSFKSGVLGHFPVALNHPSSCNTTNLNKNNNIVPFQYSSYFHVCRVNRVAFFLLG